MTYGSVQFSTYHAVGYNLQSLALPNTIIDIISGSAAGATATGLTYPLDLLRTRFAAQAQERVYASLRRGIRDIARQEGIGGFYQGAGLALWQTIPSTGLYFCAFEALKPLVSGFELPFGLGILGAGALARVCEKAGTFPLDSIRRRLQVQGPALMKYGGGKIPAYGKGAWKTGKAIVLREGWRGLYRGLGVSLIKSAPASGITMWTYHGTLNLMREKRVLSTDWERTWGLSPAEGSS